MRLRGFALLALMSLFSACKGEDVGVHFFAEGQPKALSEWRVLKVDGGRLSLNEGVVPYDLNTPLFSDYAHKLRTCLLYTSPSPRDGLLSRMPSSA